MIAERLVRSRALEHLTAGAEAVVSRSAQRLMVLTYHRVADDTDDGRYTGLISATPAEFELHLRKLCERFRLVSTTEAIDALVGRGHVAAPRRVADL